MRDRFAAVIDFIRMAAIPTGLLHPVAERASIRQGYELTEITRMVVLVEVYGYVGAATLESQSSNSPNSVKISDTSSSYLRAVARNIRSHGLDGLGQWEAFSQFRYHLGF